MTAAVGPRTWLRRFHTTPDPATRPIQLVCLPHAGGAAGWFIPFSAELCGVADVLAVQYPGHQDRWHEPAVDDLRAGPAGRRRARTGPGRPPAGAVRAQHGCPGGV